MVLQVERSKAQKRLIRLCRDLICTDIYPHIARKQKEATRIKKYEIICKLIIKEISEVLLGREILYDEIVKNKNLAFLFVPKRYKMISLENDSILSLRKFVLQNRDFVSPEMLGSISELFHGHKPAIENNSVHLIFNPERRNSGKIYTPRDLTSYMCKQSLIGLLDACHSPKEVLELKILDPSCGSGAFLLQACRTIFEYCNKRFGANAISKDEIFENILHGVDIDSFAISLCKLTLWIESGETEEIDLKLTRHDALSLGGKPKLSRWNRIMRINLEYGYDAVIGNPPYVRVASSEYTDFALNETKNMAGLFLELGMNLLKSGGVFGMILPSGVMHSDEFQPLREFVLESDGEKRFEVFDSVPDFLFDQGKLEKNSNTNINQRTVIVLVKLSEEVKILTSKLLRWRRVEREFLFEKRELIEIDSSDCYLGRIPMISKKDELDFLRRITKNNSKKIQDSLVMDNGRELFYTKAVRYFITILPRKLDREGLAQLMVSSKYFSVVHATLNSNVFYWWWRVFGNGFQVEEKLILNFPLLEINQPNQHSKLLIDSERICHTQKKNADKIIPNVNYNKQAAVLIGVDKAIFEILGSKYRDFHIKSKSNSLFERLDQLNGYNGGNHE